MAPVTTAGCRSDGMRRLAQSLHTRILTAQRDTRASFLPSMDPTAFPARPLADSETNKLPGGHGQLRCGVVLREESIQPTARLYLPVVSWHLLLILAGRLSQPPEPITITCCPAYSSRRSTHSAARTESCLARLPAVQQREQRGVLRGLSTTPGYKSDTIEACAACIGKCTAALMQCKHPPVNFATRHIGFAATNTRDGFLRAYTPTSHSTNEKCRRKYSGFM